MRYIKIIKATFPKSNFAQNNQSQISEKIDFRKIIKAKFTENRFYQNNQSRIFKKTKKIPRFFAGFSFFTGFRYWLLGTF